MNLLIVYRADLGDVVVDLAVVDVAVVAEGELEEIQEVVIKTRISKAAEIEDNLEVAEAEYRVAGRKEGDNRTYTAAETIEISTNLISRNKDIILVEEVEAGVDPSITEEDDTK